MSIRSRLLLLLLTVSLLSIVVVAAIGFRSGRANLTAAIYDHLTSVRASKAHQIRSYLMLLRDHVAVLGQDHMVADAAERFRAAWAELEEATLPDGAEATLDAYYREEFLPRLARNLEGEPVFEAYRPRTPAGRYLQYHYVAANPNPVGGKQRLDDAADGSRYSEVHAAYHPIFRDLVERFGYYDMFIVDPGTGSIVYSVHKETDFATGLEAGPYSHSSLARLVAKLRANADRGYVELADFAPYRPSYAAPAAFLATPIVRGRELLGVLAFQLPVAELDRIMTGGRRWREDGLGASGETYLVGSDYLMRSISRFLVEDPEGYAQALGQAGLPEERVQRILQLGTSILQQEVRTEASRAALEGRSGTEVVDDYRGVPVLSSFAPVEVADVRWAILSEMDLAEAEAPVREFTRHVVLSSVLLMFLLTALAMWLSARFVRPVDRIVEDARRIAAGDDEARIEAGRRDELGELGESFNAVLDRLREEAARAERRSRQNEGLLFSVLPSSVARRLRAGEAEIADAYESVSVVMSDLSGFNRLARELSAERAVGLLNGLVTSFDSAADRLGVEKIKTIGDGYMAACGLSVSRIDHAKRAVDFALEMSRIVERFNQQHGLALEIRAGVASGSLVAGIIGRTRFHYDVWGDTVSEAARLRDAAPSGGVYVGQAVYDKIADMVVLESLPATEEGLRRWRVAVEGAPQGGSTA